VSCSPSARTMWTSNAGSIRIQRTLLKTNRGLEVGETKTASSRRTIPVGKAATQALRAHRTRQIEERFKVGLAWTDNGLVFTDEVGGLLDGTAVTRTSFYSLLRRAGLSPCASTTCATLPQRCCSRRGCHR
jgi:integrase